MKRMEKSSNYLTLAGTKQTLDASTLTAAAAKTIIATKTAYFYAAEINCNIS